MKKALRIILFVIGLLLIAVFFVTVAWDYNLINTNMFAVPLGIEFTIILSSVLFFVPGAICITVAIIMKRRAKK